MSWINADSYLLIKTDAAISFAQKNSLQAAGDVMGAYFFNRRVLVNIYEERSYLQADFFDLQNEKWSRELQNKVLDLNMAAQEDIREVIASLTDNVNLEGVLRKESMDQFQVILYTIDTYMQDFLAGDLRQYQRWLTPLEEGHRQKMKALAGRLLNPLDARQSDLDGVDTILFS